MLKLLEEHKGWEIYRGTNAPGSRGSVKRMFWFRAIRKSDGKTYELKPSYDAPVRIQDVRRLIDVLEEGEAKYKPAREG